MFSVRLAAFVRDLTRFAAAGSEDDSRRALRAPFSGVPNVDGRALAVVAGERSTLRETIERERVALPRASALGARRFLAALDALRTAYRAQSATLLGHLETISIAFDFAHALEPQERETFVLLRAAAAAYDANTPAGTVWELAPALAAFERCRHNAPRDAVMPDVAHPLAARVQEVAQPVRRFGGTFSASSLGMFAECERRWFYRYVCGVLEDRPSAASTYGSAFHWALEHFHQEFPRSDAASPELLERKLDAMLGAAFERFRFGFPTAIEYELQRRRARRTGKRYLAWFLERSRTQPFEVIGTETAVEAMLGGHAFIGYIDRLDKDARGAVTVIDYKTGSIAASATEYRAKVANFLDFQLPFYYWARSMAGDRVTRLALVPLKDHLRTVEPIELEVVPVAAPPSWSDAPAGTIGIDELERARAKMIEIAERLAKTPPAYFAATDDAERCTFCLYTAACTARPLVREDRFGR